MKQVDIAIIGGGPAGLSCALTLAAAKRRHEFAAGLSFCVVDAGDSDLKKAALNYVPGVAIGTQGAAEIASLIAQIAVFEEGFALLHGRVESCTPEGESYRLKVEAGEEITARIVVLATGFHGFDIDGLGLQTIPHALSPRPGKIQLASDAQGRVGPNLYAAGLLAGAWTMYACAAGSGTAVACTILSELNGKNTIVHDVVSAG